MKKIIFTIIISVILTLTVAAQELNSFFPQNNNIKSWEKEIPFNVKMEEIQKLKTNEELEWIFYSLSRGDTSIMKDFLILDFNNDGVNDLLYLGSTGEHVILFKGNGDSYEKVILLTGQIFYTNLPGQNQPLSFAIYNYACCMGRVDFVEYYTPLVQIDSIRYVLQQREAYITGTIFPSTKLLSPVPFKTVQDIYKLRLEPVLDDITEYWTEEEGKGNVIAEYPKGSIGVALAEQKDSTGRIWWFVKMANNKPFRSMFYHGDNNEDPYFSYGWMSNRYLDIKGL